MNEGERLLKLESKIETSTEAMTKLTNQISLLVQSNQHTNELFSKNEKMTEDNRDRIVVLEKKSDVRDSKAVMYVWVERTVVVGVMGAILKGAGVI